MNILVTGGCGFIGSHTCAELLQRGYNVIIADNLVNSKEEVLDKIFEITKKKPVFYRGDVRDTDFLKSIFQKEDLDGVIHFAGFKAVGESVKEPLKYYRNNLDCTLSLLEAMKEYNVKKLVFSSSATVYGVNNPVPYNEGMQRSSTNPYGSTKVMIEQILEDLFNSDNSWSIAILRYFNPIGAHQSGFLGENPNGIPNNLFPFISKIASGKLPCLSIFGNDYDTLDGTGVRDYIHVVDLARGH
ncbi:MAG: UDP-glucose 4-epimerase GalE, partial [Oscillospiraceae bacterium]